MLELKFYKSPWEAIKLILICSPFFLFKLHNIITHKQIIPAVLNTAFFCFACSGTVIGLIKLLDRRPELIISEAGIVNIKTNKEPINWDVIKDAYIKNLQITRIVSVPFLCLVIDLNTPILIKSNKRLIIFSKKLGFEGAAIELSQLKRSNWQNLADLIKAMAHTDATTRKHLLLTTQR